MSVDSNKRLQNVIKTKLSQLASVGTYGIDQTNVEEKLLNDFTDQEALRFNQSDANQNKVFTKENEVTLFVSSNKRDKSLFPSPSFYKIDLDSEIDRIVACTLVQANFPLIVENIQSMEFSYSFSPFDVLHKVCVPGGVYKGVLLAVEITRQMNQVLHTNEILSGLYYIDATSGSVFDKQTKAFPVGVLQFRVVFLVQFRRIVFQLVDDNKNVSNTPFALHFAAQNISSEAMGFGRHEIVENAVWDSNSETYYVATSVPSLFTTALHVDERLSWSIMGNQSPNLRGRILIVLDIDPLNGTGIENAFGLKKNVFGVIPIKPSFCNDGILEINSTSYPVSRVYHQGVTRVKQLTVRVLNDDGSLFDFDGQEHFFTLRFKVLTSENTSSFCR